MCPTLGTVVPLVHATHATHDAHMPGYARQTHMYVWVPTSLTRPSVRTAGQKSRAAV